MRRAPHRVGPQDAAALAVAAGDALRVDHQRRRRDFIEPAAVHVAGRPEDELRRAERVVVEVQFAAERADERRRKVRDGLRLVARLRLEVRGQLVDQPRGDGGGPGKRFGIVASFDLVHDAGGDELAKLVRTRGPLGTFSRATQRRQEDRR